MKPEAARLRQEPKAAPKEEPKMMEEKGKQKKKMLEMPKTGGPGMGMSVPASVLLLGGGIVAFAVVRRRSYPKYKVSGGGRGGGVTAPPRPFSCLEMCVFRRLPDSPS